MVFLLHQLLREAAAQVPDREAVRCGGNSLTYGQLEAAANGLARHLIDAGIRPGDRVGIHVPKRVELVAAVYGALKAGTAYVPLDTGAPTARVAAVAADCGIAALVTTSSRARPLLTALGTHRLRLVVLLEEPTGPGADARSSLRCPWIDYEVAAAHEDASDPEVAVIDMDLAYILYTSGSTGVPKGVMLTHRNALAFVEWCAERIGVYPEDRLSNHAPLHFDLSVFDLYVSALAKATVVLVPEEDAFFGAALARFIDAEGITVWYSVPSALSLIARALPEQGACPQLRVLVFAGEVFPSKHLRELGRLLPHASLWNLYGPTETNVCTYYPVEELPDEDRTIPIGRACENTEVFAIRDDDSEAGVGEQGELCVRGPTVMKGYWGRPDATARVLVADPRAPELGDRVYRTGDLVVLRSDGDYDFLGRRDHQVKSRGYRIELGDIETALHSHASVAQAVAVPTPHDEWGTAIVACVVARRGEEITEREVRRHLSSRLPRYMLPAQVRVMEDLPRTSTGKVDRRRVLKELTDSPA